MTRYYGITQDWSHVRDGLLPAASAGVLAAVGPLGSGWLTHLDFKVVHGAASDTYSVSPGGA